MTESSRIAVFTPSYRGDLEQFALLRESIRLFAPTLPHVALVHTEDYGRFKRRFRSDTKLEIVKTAEVLPDHVEKQRRKSGPPWLTGSWLWGPRIKGWHAQQLTKIYALAHLKYDAAVFLDSDVLICRPLDIDYFFTDGRLKLFRQQASNAEAFDFDISTHDILGHSLEKLTKKDLFDFVFHPACFRKSTAVRLLTELLHRRDTEARWIRYFVRETRASEYNLLGYTATVLEHCENYCLTECRPTDLHHSVRFPEDRARFQIEMQNMLTQPKQFALIQSTVRIDPAKIAEAFHRLVSEQRSATE